MPVDGHGRIIALSMACRAHQRPLLTQNTLFHGGNTGSNPVGDAINTRRAGTRLLAVAPTRINRCLPLGTAPRHG